MLILVGGFGTWAATTNISGAIIASGQIEVDQNRQVVQHPDGGVVDEILVDEGDTVDSRRYADPARSDPAAVRAHHRRGPVLRTRSRAAPGFRRSATRRTRSKFPSEVLEIAPRRTRRSPTRSRASETSSTRATRASTERSSNWASAASRSPTRSSESMRSRQALGRQLELIESELSRPAIPARPRPRAGKSGAVAAARRGEPLGPGRRARRASKAQSEGRITEIEIERLKLRHQRREEAITELRDLQYRERELAEERRAIARAAFDRLDIKAPVAGSSTA